jgi:UDP-N-acetylglucosamine 4,6-dehydratase
VNLVIYAFENGKPGDIFVQKAPAATIASIAEGLKTVFKSDCPIQIIGTRHGEKLYETLLTREEMARAKDLGDYFRIPADTRDLNYSLYFTEGEERVSREQDYNSHNTRRLGLDEIIGVLSSLDIVQEELKDWK